MGRFTGLVFSCVAAALALGGEARALVGASEENGPLTPYTLMVLKRAPSGSGFCSGVVIARDVVLTAAHCVYKLDDTRVFFPEPAGVPMLKPVRAISVHPQYRANAPQTRERSIDLALVRTMAPLPARFQPVELDERGSVSVGTRYRIAGFGVTREGWGDTAGTLRWGQLAARAPLSSILLWAEDPQKKNFGACEGDSGGPIFAADSDTLVAITSWSEGLGKTNCGKLTQAALIAPQRAWIARVLKSWGE